MLLTWDNREGSRLTSHGYGLAGGVSHAVQASADAVYDALSAEQQDLARELLRSMTVASRGGRLSRRPVTMAELRAGHPETGRSQLDAVLEAFAAKRLVVLNDGTAQISHDALLRAWPRLRGWLEDDHASWIFHSQLTEDVAAWHGSHQDPSFLYRGTQLAALHHAAAGWAADPGRYPALTRTQRDFLRASDRAAARSTRQRRMLAAVLVLLLIASLAGAVVAVTGARNANRQRSLAVSGQLAAESEALDITDPVTASLLAAAAWRIAPTAQARASMLDVLAQPGRAVLTSGTGALIDLAFSPGGKLLATGINNGTARLWNVATHRPIGAPLPVGGKLVYAVAFSPDGKILATVPADGPVMLWDVATRRPIGRLRPTGAGGLNEDAVAFSPDGKLMATAGAEGAVRLWDVATRQQIGAPLAIGDGQLDGVAFSPDGKDLAIAGDTARLWDVATRQQIGAPMRASTGPAGSNSVYGLAFSPDGKRLATAGSDGTARLWDVASRHQIGVAMPAAANGNVVDTVAFSPDGRILATAGDVAPARLWDVATRQQIGAPLPAEP